MSGSDLCAVWLASSWRGVVVCGETAYTNSTLSLHWKMNPGQAIVTGFNSCAPKERWILMRCWMLPASLLTTVIPIHPHPTTTHIHACMQCCAMLCHAHAQVTTHDGSCSAQPMQGNAQNSCQSGQPMLDAQLHAARSAHLHVALCYARPPK